MPFHRVQSTREMGEALEPRAGRSHAGRRWLATERLPDWDLFLAVAGEVHGAIEGLWHGVDPAIRLRASLGGRRELRP